MKAVFTLTSAESRRLIAKGVTQKEEVLLAKEKGYIIIAGGTTNAYVAQELTGDESIDPRRYTVGTNTGGILCVNNSEDRDSKLPVILYKGKVVNKTIPEALEDFHKETVVIKGANCIDPEGNVGVVTSGFDGGTVAKTIGTVTSTGLDYIVPVGLEKMIPSVKEAAKVVGARTFDYSMGADFGIYCLTKTKPVTEIQVLRILANVEATQVAAGGIGGSEGSVTLVIAGEDSDVQKAIELIESIKGEPPIRPLKGDCESCNYPGCKFCGRKSEELPAWLRQQEEL